MIKIGQFKLLAFFCEMSILILPATVKGTWAYMVGELDCNNENHRLSFR